MAARPQTRKRSRLTLCVGLAVGLALFFYLMSGSPTDLVDERTPDYGKAGWRYSPTDILSSDMSVLATLHIWSIRWSLGCVI